MFSSRRQSAIPGFRLQNYGFKNNPTVTIVTVGYLKKHKKSVGEWISPFLKSMMIRLMSTPSYIYP